jgi:DNA topoisomerase-1
MSAAQERPGEETASGAGLIYVSDGDEGFTRRRCGRGFSYRDEKGRVVKSAMQRARFASLAIPPAWTDVWICRHAEGHLQATGRDEAGRKQYIYHPLWREARDEAKYQRMLEFGKLLPKIREQVRRDLRKRRLTRDRVIAAVVRLLETSFARVGNYRYARDNDSFGLTTLRKRHVSTSNGVLLLTFRGKGGKPWEIEVADASIASVLRACMKIPGRELFKYLDESGRRQCVTANDVNAYLQAVAQADVTAKDFRTWAGTVLAASALEEAERADPSAHAKRKIGRAVESVAEELGNTPAICKNCYVHPEVIGGYEDGVLLENLRDKPRRDLAGLRPHEAAVLAFLEQRIQLASP